MARPAEPAANGSRPSRLARLNERRAKRGRQFRRFLRFTAIGTLLPGTGLLAAGRRRLGAVVLGAVVLGVVVAAVLAWQTSLTDVLDMAFNRRQLALVGGGLAIVAGGWLLVALISHYSLEPRELSAGRRLAGALVFIVVASLVTAPLALGAQYAFAQRDLVAGISRQSSTRPELAHDNPWATKERVNVLLMGSDAGDGRVGVRPDTLIVASIETKTGETVLFSLPRNLERVPFPAGTELHEAFPDGFTNGEPEDLNFMINSVYENAPSFVSDDAFAGSDDPGADATKLAVSAALGLRVDYYVMVNLAGFKQLVDAIGGITVDVNYPVPMGTFVNSGTGVCEWTSKPDRWIMPGGNQRLDGSHALWFARARCAPYDEKFPDKSGTESVVNSDYNRMERQRCVIGAVAESADPLNLILQYQSLAAAAKDNVSTDIPVELLSAFAELGLLIKDASIRSLAFTNEVVEDRRYPDYGRIRQLVADALDPALRSPSSGAPSAPPSPESASAGHEWPSSQGGQNSSKSPDSTEAPADRAQDVAKVC